MNDTAGYIQDVAYPDLYHREMAPNWIACVLRALGEPGLVPEATPDAPLRWCELGCGGGLDLSIAAANHPRGDFVGIDSNPGHVRAARDLAEAAGLTNVTFLLGDLNDPAGMAEEGNFNVVALHGVWSWIGPETRRPILSFLRRTLRPGGLLYLHHMTHPGMSSFAAARELIRRVGVRAGGDAARQVGHGMALLDTLARAGAGYFVANPHEAERLLKAGEQDGGYLAHEFMNLHWEPLHIAEVMDEMAGIGLRRIGSAVPIENIDAASLPSGIPSLLRAHTDPAVVEAIKDLSRNQTERRDLYRMGGSPLSEEAHRAALWSQGYASLPGAPVSGSLTFQTLIGPVEGEASLFDPLLRAFATGPQSFASLARLPLFASSPGGLSPALQMLLWAGIIHPLADPMPPADAARRLNRALCARHEGSDRSIHLAMPVIGGALPVAGADLPLILDATGGECWPPPSGGDRIVAIWRSLGLVR